MAQLDRDIFDCPECGEPISLFMGDYVEYNIEKGLVSCPHCGEEIDVDYFRD